MPKWEVAKIYQNVNLKTNFRAIASVKEVCDCTTVTYQYLLDWDLSKGLPTMEDFDLDIRYNKTYKKNPEGFFTQI